MATPAALFRRIAPLGVLTAALLVAACGDGYHDGPIYDPYYPPVYYGTVVVDNQTDTTTVEDVLTFYLAPAGTGSFTGNLLSGPLPPGFAEDVGDFVEDYYDAEADLEFGDLVTWYDVAVPGGDVTTFEVF